jgi:Ca2+/H+ antiporter
VDDRRLTLAGRVAAGSALALACLAAPLVGKVGIFKYFQTGVTYMKRLTLWFGLYAAIWAFLYWRFW